MAKACWSIVGLVGRLGARLDMYLWASHVNLAMKS